MATDCQINANRANAQKSTGSTTPEGKAKSCMNHLSHGFSSATSFLFTEHEEEFNHSQWNSLRAICLQTIALQASIPNGYIHKDLGLLVRYQTAADRAYHKAHEELLKS